MGVLNKLFPGTQEYPKNSAGKNIALGFQHAFAMSCATILVPLLTGLDVGVALFAAGVGTLIFHLCTGGRMPTFLGSSFAFIAAILGVVGNSDFGATKEEQIAAAMGGVIAAGAIYLVMALIVRLCGKRFIDKLFPPVVRGVGIALIGLGLASSAIGNIQPVGADGAVVFGPLYIWSWVIAAIVCLLAIILSSYGKGMVKMSSIVIALAGGYLFTLLVVELGWAPVELMNFSALAEQGRGFARGWLEVPNFVLPTFNLRAISMIAPIAIVTCVEHVGDVYANGAVVGKDFTKNPGLHRTLLGDGLATMVAGAFGGHYNPVTLRIAAVIAILVSFFGKGIGAIETIPTPVLGGACIVLYGMIASVGLRTLVENHVDFTKNRNLCIAAVMFVLAIGGAVIGGPSFSLSGMGLGIIVGIVLNLILPEQKESGLIAHEKDESQIVEESK